MEEGTCTSLEKCVYFQQNPYFTTRKRPRNCLKRYKTEACVIFALEGDEVERMQSPQYVAGAKK